MNAEWCLAELTRKSRFLENRDLRDYVAAKVYSDVGNSVLLEVLGCQQTGFGRFAKISNVENCRGFSRSQKVLIVTSEALILRETYTTLCLILDGLHNGLPSELVENRLFQSI